MKAPKNIAIIGAGRWRSIRSRNDQERNAACGLSIYDKRARDGLGCNRTVRA